MALTLEQYANYLDTRALPWPAPPVADPPRAKLHLKPMAEIRAVLWNVYGTVLAIPGGIVARVSNGPWGVAGPIPGIPRVEQRHRSTPC